MEFLLLWIAFAVVSAIVAGSKGRSAFGWFILGAIFGIFAMILVIVLPSQKVAPVDPNAPSPETHVKCPDCRELVFKDAKKYRYCGTPLVPQ